MFRPNHLIMGKCGSRFKIRITITLRGKEERPIRANDGFSSREPMIFLTAWSRRT